MGIDPMNNISIIVRILFAVTLFQQYDIRTESKDLIGSEGASLHMIGRQTSYETQREQSLHMS
jgi:hypothetical protein